MTSSVFELCEALDCPCPREAQPEGDETQIWTQCRPSGVLWLLLLAERLNLCDNRTFVQLAYDFAMRVRDPTDAYTENALRVVECCLAVEQAHADQVAVQALSLYTSWKWTSASSSSAGHAAREALWAAGVSAASSSSPQLAVRLATAGAARAAAEARVGGEEEAERAWQCEHIRRLIRAPKLPDDLIVAVAAKRLREAP